MRPAWSRRRLLRAGSLGLAAGVAGCGGTQLSSPTPTDADAGTESYGIRARNETDRQHSLTVTAGPVWEDEQLFSAEFDLDGGSEQSWDGALTPVEGEDGPKEVVVAVELEPIRGRDADAPKDEKRLNGNLYLTPGADSAPEAADVQITVRMEMVYNEHEMPVVVVSAGPPPSPTPWGP